MSQLIGQQNISNMVFSDLMLERLFPPSNTVKVETNHGKFFCDLMIVTLAFCLVTVCIVCFTNYLAYLARNEAHDTRLLNVLNGNLALNMQLLSLIFVSMILEAVADTNSVEDNTISTLEAVRIFAETNQTLLVAQLTLATCVKVRDSNQGLQRFNSHREVPTLLVPFLG